MYIYVCVCVYMHMRTCDRADGPVDYRVGIVHMRICMYLIVSICVCVHLLASTTVLI